MKILITESIAEESVQYLRDRGYEVEEYLGHSQEEIEQYIKGFDAIIVRSATKINETLLDNADCLKAVGRAGTGIDNIDVKACTEHGVIALNTPTANNMAAGELAVGHAFSIFRNLCAANEGVHNGDFRRGNWVGIELEGKTAGIIGLGRIGSIVATLTRLASTLTARYFPSSSLTDAFYLDGRLCGKRETRQADITIDKDERGFFFSLFTHPAIEGFEPGTIPPFEPQLRGLCNEVKNGHKEIDAMIEKFLSTAVEVAGTTKLIDNETRDPYFTGVIVRDSEAFAVTIGGGLAFLYRDDTMFPLTDAGIPMEPIDAYGNRVGDFQYYCSSKTANALWSNFFTLTPDDCIILCNKAIYDALGQREILRILTDAEDQCDAAGLILTQASARMPNTPMQISISFVESVTNEEKRGLFGRKKKKDDYESETHE